MIPPLPDFGRALISQSAVRFGLTSKDLCGRRFRQAWGPARRDAMAALALAGFSPFMIGKLMGGRCRTTVLHHLAAWENGQQRQFVKALNAP